MQVSAAFIGEIEIDYNVDCLDVNASGYQVRTDKCLELSFPEALETFDSFVRFHVGVKILVVVLLFIEFS